MKGNIFKIIGLLMGALIALYITGLRLISFLMEYGNQTPETDTWRNFMVITVPDFISIIFCFYFVIYFLVKTRNLSKT